MLKAMLNNTEKKERKIAKVKESHTKVQTQKIAELRNRKHIARFH